MAREDLTNKTLSEVTAALAREGNRIAHQQVPSDEVMRTPIIEIALEGGLISILYKSPGVVLRLRDYDAPEDYDANGEREEVLAQGFILRTDPNGQEYRFDEHAEEVKIVDDVIGGE